MKEGPIQRWLPAILVLVGTSCGSKPAQKKPSRADCGSVRCPVGTSPYELQSLYLEAVDDLSLVDVTDGPSQATNDAGQSTGGIGYVIRSETDCEFACVAIEPCPSHTVPVITEDCYTCAQLTESGEVYGSSCDYEGDFVESEGTTSPWDEEDEWEPPSEEEIPGHDGSAPYCRTSWRTIAEGDLDGNMSIDSDYNDQADEPQDVGEINESITLSGWLDRIDPATPDCMDTDIFTGEYTCQGTASLSIDATTPVSVEVEIGGMIYNRSQSSIPIEPGPFSVHITCNGDWGGYDIEVEIGG